MFIMLLRPALPLKCSTQHSSSIECKIGCGCSYVSGYTIFSIRAVEALAGCLTLLFFYLFARAAFGRNIAILSLFLMALSKPHLIYSRLGYRISLSLLFEVSSLYFLVAALQSDKKKTLNFILAGSISGLGAYTYISYRIFPLVVIALLLDPGIRNLVRSHTKRLIAAGTISFAIAAPLLWFYVQQPEAFSYRMQWVSAWNQQQEQGVLRIARSARDTLAMFTYKGDARARQNVPEEPAVSPFVTAFFLLGFIFLLTRRQKPFAIFLILYLFIPLLPGILSREAPHFGRTLGALPAAILLTAIGTLSVYRFLKIHSDSLARIFLYVITGGVLLTGINDALFRYSKTLDAFFLQEQMNGMEANVAVYQNGLGSRHQVLLSPQLFFHATCEFLTYSKSSHELYLPETQYDSEKIKVVVLVPDVRDLWWLRDDDAIHYFWWWSKFYGMDVPFIRDLLAKTYDLRPQIIDQSDAHILQSLKRTHPNGKEIRFDQFAVFLFR